MEESKSREDDGVSNSSPALEKNENDPLISLTIKTLDSQNHKIDKVDENSSIKNFKEKIANTVGIAAERQRLIYCGRVLNDEKKLKEYSLNGKVVHLVQRQPPGNSAGPDRLAASEARARSRGASPRGGRHQHHIHVHGPINASVNVGQPSMLVRLNLARSMLRRANARIDRLENPDASTQAGTQQTGNGSRPNSRSGDATLSQSDPSVNVNTNTPVSAANTTATASRSRSEANIRTSSTPNGVQILASSGMPAMDGGGLPPELAQAMPPELAQAIQTAVNQAIHSAQNVDANTNRGADGNENGSTSRTLAMSFQVVDGQLIQTDNGQPTETRESANSSNERPLPSQNTASNTRTTGSTPTRHSPPLAVDHPPPRMMADVMAEYRRTQERLVTHWDRLDRLLRDDPEFEGENQRNIHQNLFRGVTEIMHFLSHAQHAISDAMINLSSSPPRQLRARPFMIAPIVQSAVVQNVPMHVQVPPGENRRREAAANSSLSTSSNPDTPAVVPMETSDSSSDNEINSGGATQNISMTTTGSDQHNSTIGNENSAAVADIEVSVEPIVVGIEMGPDTSVGPREGSDNPSNEASVGSSPSPTDQTGTPRRNGGPSADMIQNMIQAALSNMGAVANVTVQEITPDSLLNSSANNNASNTSNQPGQNSRARVNTQTQPTTSTRTRSTTQVINVPAGAMGPPMGFMGPNGFQGGPLGPLPNNNFDILLPCNSHHIPQNAISRGGIGRGNRRIQPHPVFQQHRPRSSSVPPRGQVRGNPATPASRGTQPGPNQGDIPVAQGQTRHVTSSANASPHQSPGRMQQTAALPGGGSVTIDFNSSFDIGSFFGRVPQTPAQREPNSRRDEDLTRRPANVPSESDRSNSVPSELEPGLNNLINILQQTNQMAGNIQNQFGQGNSTTSAFPNAVGQSIPDDGMLNVIQGIVGQVMGAMGVPSASGVVNENQSPTISQFLESMPDYSYTDGDDIVTDFLMSLARVLTFRDLISMVGGRGTENRLSSSSREAIGRLQEPMQTFMRRRMLNYDANEVLNPSDRSLPPPTDEEIESAFLRLLDESFSPHLETCAEVSNVRDNIDFAETIHNFLTIRLTALASGCVWNTQLTSHQFGERFYDDGRNFLADLTRLCLMCFTDGQSSIERVVQNRLSNISDDVGSTVSQWTMSTAVGHLRNYVADVVRNGETDIDMFNRFVIRPEASAARKKERQGRLEQRRDDGEVASATCREAASDTQEEEDTFETPRSSPEIMATDETLSEANTNGPMDLEIPTQIPNSDASIDMSNSTPDSTSIPTPDPQSSDLSFPSELLPRTQGIDMVVGREAWHRQVPAEWVPIITRDTQNQQHIPPIAPYSDAYLSTQPAKKRRLAEAKKPDGTIEKVISDTLKDAIKVTGVQPKVSATGVSPNNAGNSNISVDVAKDVGVQAAIKNDTRGAIKRRLQQDPDYHPEKFPSSHDYTLKK